MEDTGPTVDVEFMVPARARARAKPTGKWHEGVVEVPVTVTLEDVDADVVAGMRWRNQRFAGDGERLFALVKNHTDPDDLGCVAGRHLGFRRGAYTASGEVGVATEGYVPDPVRRLLEIPIKHDALRRFDALAIGNAWKGDLMTEVEHRGKLAFRNPEGTLEVVPPDVAAIRAVMSEQLAVDREGRLVARLPSLEAVLTTDFEIVPSVHRTDPKDEILRFPLEPDGTLAVPTFPEVEMRKRTPDHPVGACPEAVDRRGRLGRLPDAAARRRMVATFGEDLVSFPDDARDAYTPLRPDIEGADDAVGTRALVELLGTWRPHLDADKGVRCDVLLHCVARAEAALEARATRDAVFRSF